MTTSHAPAPLPRSARAMLAAYRDAHEIPREIDDRIWSVVGADDAPEPAFDPLEPSPPRRTSMRMIDMFGWGGAALAIAAVLLLAWRMGGWIAERRAPDSTPTQAVMHEDGGAQRRATTRAPHRAAPSSSASATAPEPAVEPPSANPEPTGASVEVEPPSTNNAIHRPHRAAPERIEPAPSPSSTLAAEVAMVARARRALAANHIGDALDITAEHARRFPHGVLVPERAALETIARCRMGDGDRAQRALAFHRAHADSPFAARVDEACGVNPKQR